MNKACILVLLAAIAVTAGGCEILKGQGDSQESKTMAGAYVPMRQVSEEELELFRSLIPSSDTVYTPLSVATQVVNGTNFKYLCRFEDKVNSTTGECIAVIYKPLQGKPVLSMLGEPVNISFTTMEEKVFRNFKGGRKEVSARMYSDSLNRMMQGHIKPGASIGMHTHDSDSEIVFITKGSGYAVYDGTIVTLREGDVHYCRKGHSHMIVNDGRTDIEFYSVITSH